MSEDDVKRWLELSGCFLCAKHFSYIVFFNLLARCELIFWNVVVMPGSILNSLRLTHLNFTSISEAGSTISPIL